MSVLLKVHWTGAAGRETTLQVEADEALGPTLRRAAATLGLSVDEPAGHQGWVAATADGGWYTQRPFHSEAPLASILPGKSEVELWVEVTPLCMHGSPAVRGRGHLCGWC